MQLISDTIKFVALDPIHSRMLKTDTGDYITVYNALDINIGGYHKNVIDEFYFTEVSFGGLPRNYATHVKVVNNSFVLDIDSLDEVKKNKLYSLPGPHEIMLDDEDVIYIYTKAIK